MVRLRFTSVNVCPNFRSHCFPSSFLFVFSLIFDFLSCSFSTFLQLLFHIRIFALSNPERLSYPSVHRTRNLHSLLSRRCLTLWSETVVGKSRIWFYSEVCTQSGLKLTNFVPAVVSEESEQATGNRTANTYLDRKDYLAKQRQTKTTKLAIQREIIIWLINS